MRDRKQAVSNHLRPRLALNQTMTQCKSLFVIGYPSWLGGADTELWHLLRLWRRFDVNVRLIPTWQANGAMRRQCDELGIDTTSIYGGTASFIFDQDRLVLGIEVIGMDGSATLDTPLISQNVTFPALRY